VGPIKRGGSGGPSYREAKGGTTFVGSLELAREQEQLTMEPELPDL